MINLLHGDCLEQMKKLDNNSVDSIVSDPPYGISFMAKKWDYDVPSVEVWREAMRVLKPGGHALIACGTRTQHRMAVNIEDAGFEIRDVVSWIYGSGFPKSLNISKAIDKAAGAERGKVPRVRFDGKSVGKNDEDKKGWCVASDRDLMLDPAPATEAAKQWDGWGTALKPSSEFFTLCRKPLSEKTIAANVLKWGTGGINIDGCRVEANGEKTGTNGACGLSPESGWNENSMSRDVTTKQSTTQGRFPANLIHDGSQEVFDLFPETGKSSKRSPTGKPKYTGTNNDSHAMKGSSTVDNTVRGHSDNGGSAARFFYCAKASKKDRDEGLDGFEEKKAGAMTSKEYREDRPTNHPMRKNTHPTVKPTALMQYLCRLITPAGGTVLDPYMGSGSTGKAAMLEGFSFVGCEIDDNYFDIARSRIENATAL